MKESFICLFSSGDSDGNKGSCLSTQGNVMDDVFAQRRAQQTTTDNQQQVERKRALLYQAKK